MVDQNKLEKELDEALKNEDSTSLTKWLLNERGIKLYDENDMNQAFDLGYQYCKIYKSTPDSPLTWFWRMFKSKTL